MIIISVFSLFLLLSLTYININFIFHRINDDDHIQINVTILKIIKLKYKIPYIDLVFNGSLRPGIKMKSILASKKSKLSKKINIFNIDELKQMYMQFKKMKKMYNKVFSFLLSKVKYDSIKWYTKVGLSDAALTAIAVGSLWSFKSILLHSIYIRFEPGNIDINIIPNYNKLIFEIDLNCIIRLKIANIIIAGLKFVTVLFSNVLFKRGDN